MLLDLNLLEISKKKILLKNKISSVAFSGHHNGIAPDIAAYVLGASYIERHFTIDRTWKGTDHAASLEPHGFSKMVRDIRHIENAMGGFEKNLQESEKPIFKKLAKSIVSSVDIKRGQIISLDMLTTKGPGSGVSPTRFHEIIGKKLNKNIIADVVIKNEDVIWS